MSHLRNRLLLSALSLSLALAVTGCAWSSDPAEAGQPALPGATPVVTMTSAVEPPPAASSTSVVPAATDPQPRYVDPNLEALGVTIEEAEVAEGEPYWRLIELLWQDERLAAGGINIYVDVVDGLGNRRVGQPFTLWWGEGSATQVIEEKPFPEYGGSFPMFVPGHVYSLKIDGLPSDAVHGMGLGDLDRREWPVRVQYLLRFQKTIR